ncbi:MAG TPA: hypothetical protein PKW23_00480 [Dictyoglomaceae bacterium]|nr:hypothetical protein [Dictyoglomaceae bacterium]HOL39164.1 hypothetical protein [Dictyoglomaceae bacterium]HOP94227.1 hypothetical protein [Dictyoglomaceae bacterium]HPP15318.1 hypothetical protein [Dictyoglomaceae bacterium]HPU42725.1 hypothetical protein [Dictyoglomaceae bacterium]
MKKNQFKKYLLLALLLCVLNLGIAKESFLVDFSKNPPKGNLVFELGKGMSLEKEDGDFHLVFLKGGSSLKIYTPVSSLTSPKRIILRITGMASSFLTQDSWAPVEIIVNSKTLIKGFDFGTDFYITPSLNISEFWVSGQTNVIEICLEKEASGEFWVKKVEIVIYEK